MSFFNRFRRAITWDDRQVEQQFLGYQKQLACPLPGTGWRHRIPDTKCKKAYHLKFNHMIL